MWQKTYDDCKGLGPGGDSMILNHLCFSKSTKSSNTGFLENIISSSLIFFFFRSSITIFFNRFNTKANTNYLWSNGSRIKVQVDKGSNWRKSNL